VIDYKNIGIIAPFNDIVLLCDSFLLQKSDIILFGNKKRDYFIIFAQ